MISIYCVSTMLTVARVCLIGHLGQVGYLMEYASRDDTYSQHTNKKRSHIGEEGKPYGDKDFWGEQVWERSSLARQGLGI